jgi:hypothetical protein
MALCPLKINMILKLSLHQNSIIIHHKFNSNVKNLINFERP